MNDMNVHSSSAASDPIKKEHLGLALTIGMNALRFSSMLTLLLMALFLWRLVIDRPMFLYEEELDSLKILKYQVETGSSTPSDVNPPPTSAEPISGAVGKQTSALTGVEVGVAGVATVSVPPVLWLIVCVIGAIILVVMLERMITYVVAQWRLVATCGWRGSLLSFLGCLWVTIWALIVTVVTILWIALILVCVLTNIAALVAIF